MYRSALSAFHPSFDNIPIGQLPEVTSLLKAIHNECPPKPSSQGTWDVNEVLEYIKGLGSNEQMSIQDLSHKTAMLLALTTAVRASELRALSTEFMTDVGPQNTLTMDTLSKTSKQGESLPSLTLHEFAKEVDLDPIVA